MLSDIRFSVRLLTRAPAFTGLAALTLALGIGAASTTFSIANGILLRPLPYPDAGRIVLVQGTDPDGHAGGQAPADYLDLRSSASSFTGLAAYRPDSFDLTGEAAEPTRLVGARVTAAFFEVFGVRAESGRTFTREDVGQGDRLLVIGHQAWLRIYGGDAAVIGRRIRLNGEPCTIVGVMPATFAWPESTDAWALARDEVPAPPMEVEGEVRTLRDLHYFEVVGRLAPQVPFAEADAEVSAVAARLAGDFPQSNAGRTMRLISLHDAIVGDVRPALLVLLGSVALVLLIGCANVAGLLIARGAGRHREMALRTALGAARRRLARQLLTESLLLAVGGGALGLLVSVWSIDPLLRLLPESIPRLREITVDARVIAVTGLISVATGILFGMLPAWQSTRVDLVTALKEGGDRGTGSSPASRMRRALIIGEVAVTLMLLAGAGLLFESFVRLRGVDPGFRTGSLTWMTLPVPQQRYTDTATLSTFYGQVLEDLATRAPIESAAVAFPQPFQGDNAHGAFYIEGVDSTDRADRPSASLSMISPDYFKTMGMALVAGRPFTDADTENAPAVFIVNETLARRYWPRQSAIGRRVRFDEGDAWATIVGVAADSRNLGLAAEPPPTLYIPCRQFALPFMGLLVRSSASPSLVRSLAQDAVRHIDPLVPVGRILTLDEIVGNALAQPKFRAILLALFALMALTLAAIGLYGLISYAVASRVREIGIRLALGATPHQVLVPVLREGVTLAAAGIVLGLAGSLAAMRLLAALLFGVDADDPAVLAGVSALLLVVAVVASYVPARRALRVDPVAALRAE